MDLRFAICDLQLNTMPSHAARRDRRPCLPIASVEPAQRDNCKSQIANRRAFTLMEILIVIGLIVLIIALAVPAFSFITGSRSVDAGENLVSAMLSRARSEAMLSNRVAGVAFFRDTIKDRTAMAIVVPAAQRGSLTPEPAGMEQYKAWKTTQEDGIGKVDYKPGDVVIALVDMPPPNGGKKGTKLFVCNEAHQAGAGNKPPATPYWGTLDEQEIDSLVGYEFQYLPPGISVQTINDPDPAGSGTQRDRYLRSGMILFGGDGALLHRKYVIGVPPNADQDTTHLFRMMGFDKRNTPLDQTAVGASATFPLYSQLGVVIYDEENFRTAGGTNDDPLNDNAAIGAANYNEQPEELWLDQNALSLLVNRYNGTLVRGE
jgi:type II secretory pathway pseudopilin PulG